MFWVRFRSYVTSAPGGLYHQTAPPPPQVYPTRPIMFSGGSSSTILPPPPYHHSQPCVYNTTPPRMVPPGDYYMAHGHALTGSSPSNYTYIGAPVGLPRPPGSSRDGLDQDDGLTSPY